jgi:hypothetical protein
MTTENKPEKKKEDWMNSKWRPMMGWMYMIVCFMDMVIFPIAWSLAQTLLKQPITQWNPLTLQGAGLFHIAMGAVLGIAAYGRTQEKLGGANNGGIQPPSTTPAVTNSFGAQPLGSNSGSTFGSAPSPAPATGFGSNTGFGAPAPAADVVSGFGGKPAPVIPPFPEK